ncbi:hypothetical protein EPUS_05891 [Endocarpon pusillum Z07020]|uniref:BZIP transcription factor n=1 Tax=Endocarpon pusillum (strain Z07020 / HMAS-L-300199) TaxID=1263415 RepID=U1HWT7_ENDPU|nr:uncharacterized protein EPUS_05891 [Endocarpon pusillum Z07020]ERF73879.1 hypothetical protein EPUS_05891 [Endocarpon pusillum Z07020]
MSAPGSIDLNLPSPPEATTPSSPGHPNKRRKTGPTTSRGVASLTPEQLAKKRANDREAQRAIRERTKAQIETLEKKIQELTSQQPYQELQAVIRQKDAIQAENDDIRRRLESVLSIIQPIVTAHGLTDLATAAQTDGQNQPPTTQQLGLLQGQYSDARNGTRSYSEGSPQTLGSPSPNNATAFLQNFVPPPVARPNPERVWSPIDALAYQKQNLHHGLDLNDSGERLGFGFLLDGSHHVAKVKQPNQSPREHRTSPSSQSYPPLPNSPFTDHAIAPWAAPCRNVEPTCTLDSFLLGFLQSKRNEAAQGVPAQRLVGPSYPSVSSLLNPQIESHPLSKVFTDILSTFPTIDALPQQIAVLYIMFLIMRWQIYPTQENYERLPDWMTPRPSQLFTPHPAWIDYLPWPKMRDKLVECYHDYAFEDFTLPYTTTLSLNWPYEPTDALLQSDSEELMINPVFERHLRNLSNWSLGPAFARAHPALADVARIKGDDNRTPGMQ